MYFCLCLSDFLSLYHSFIRMKMSPKELGLFKDTYSSIVVWPFMKNQQFDSAELFLGYFFHATKCWCNDSFVVVVVVVVVVLLLLLPHPSMCVFHQHQQEALGSCSNDFVWTSVIWKSSDKVQECRRQFTRVGIGESALLRKNGGSMMVVICHIKSLNLMNTTLMLSVDPYI